VLNQIDRLRDGVAEKEEELKQRETREATHIGDLFHRVFPTQPRLNEHVVLGEGTLFFDEDGVGLSPDDGRDTLWLNMHALYRVHNQTVTLFFEESPVN
jgi:hypothetical protein